MKGERASWRMVAMDSKRKTSWSNTRVVPLDEAADCKKNNFYTIKDVADLLAVSTRTVRRSIDRSELSAHDFGRSVRIAENDLKNFIARHRRT